MTTYRYRLDAAYMKLTFKHEGTPGDQARLEAFILLLTQHLISKRILDLKGWENNISNRDACLAEFITLYGKQLWPGSVAARGHLALPALKTKQRSFLASFDGRWTKKAAGWNSARKAQPKDENELLAMSKIGNALRSFIEVLLEFPIEVERYWGLPSTEELCVKATKVDGGGEGGGRSPTMSEIERDLGIGEDSGLASPGEEEEFGALSDGDEYQEASAGDGRTTGNGG